MSYGIPSDEVAEDYRKALEDLTMNSRYEISNLTVIAKENTEHALAISEALKNHIKQTSPQKKLPAFYVLDSVVKNVGTPYTLFFGRQLYSTFMEAYALVDNNVRRKMDEMLKTWKEPVPGSIDTRPVFPVEVTRPIENALIKARTSAVQAHQEHLRSQQQLLNRGRPIASPVPYRDTPTPPNTVRQPLHPQPGHASYNQHQYPTPINGQQYGNQPNGQQQYATSSQRQPNQYPPQLASLSTWQQPQLQRPHDPSIDTLNSDVANLINTSKAEFARNPSEPSIQGRLKALLDLQHYLQTEELSSDQIARIRDEVAQLSIQAQPVPVVAAQPTASLSSLLGPSALAALMARQSATPQAPTPPTHPDVPVRSPRHHPPQPSYLQPPVTASNPVPVSSDPQVVLANLRAMGILQAVSTPSSTPTLPASSLAGTLPPGFEPTTPYLSGPPQLPSSGGRSPLAEIPNDVELKPASLKIPRPHLILNLYDRLGAPCTQCGRRFQSDEEGRKKKAAHMDWHFRVRQRMAEAEKRGQHRSWYVDELDWIRSREIEDDHHKDIFDGANGSANSSSATASKPKLEYLPVPDDPALANSLCPICQEKFEIKWLDDAQEFVWMDAKKVGGDRIYHASCYAEATKDGGGNQIKRGTPEPVLGKRKAEDEHIALRTKIKSEPVS